MIYSLKGELTEILADAIVIECGGVGYFCRTTNTTISDLAQTGKEVKVYTYMNVYQDGIDLFGFSDKQELGCFKMLITVSGVGPKAALSILSSLTPAEFATKVASGDIKGLTAAKGVGKKMAERIVLELKDKVSGAEITKGREISGNISGVAAGNNQQLLDAIEALAVLGFSDADIAPYIDKIDASKDTSSIVSQILKMIGNNR